MVDVPDDLTPGLSTRQTRICRLLRRLVSEGAAELFADACGLLSEDPPRRTATHLIAHALREVEGALRDVLEPTKKIKGHEKSITAVLDLLGIDQTAPVAESWLDMAGESAPRNLAGWAHRPGLNAPRRLDNEFRNLVRDFEYVLDEVLERYRDRYVDVFSRLDEMLSIVTPTKADATALRKRFPGQPSHQTPLLQPRTGELVVPLARGRVLHRTARAHRR